MHKTIRTISTFSLIKVSKISTSSNTKKWNKTQHLTQELVNDRHRKKDYNFRIRWNKEMLLLKLTLSGIRKENCLPERTNPK